MRQLNLTYEIYRPYTTPIKDGFTDPSIELTFDIDIPLEIWARYHDNEDELVNWAIDYLFQRRIKKVIIDE